MIGSGIGIKIAAAALAASTAAGGVAAANGQLPAPIQDRVADVAQIVDIDLPRHNEVLEAVFPDGQLPTGGEDYGKDVADTASEGQSQEGLDRAESAQTDPTGSNPTGYGPDNHPDGSEFRPDLP